MTVVKNINISIVDLHSGNFIRVWFLNGRHPKGRMIESQNGSKGRMNRKAEWSIGRID